MPFLPSEGEETKLLINEQMKDVLVFHYLPILWYRYPIPNDIREFWYNERPDILDYMQKAYKDLIFNFYLIDFNLSTIKFGHGKFFPCPNFHICLLLKMLDILVNFFLILSRKYFLKLIRLIKR
jgi:hypothetical protein